MRIPVDDLEFVDGVLYVGKLFTGTSVEIWPEGAPHEEADFYHGFAHGWEREWNRKGTLIKEQYIATGLVHGLSRTWHDNGRLASEAHYQFGILLTAAQWSDAGVRGTDFRIDKTSEQYSRVQRELARVKQRNAASA